jgi:hypothetical protein
MVYSISKKDMVYFVLKFASRVTFVNFNATKRMTKLYVVISLMELFFFCFVTLSTLLQKEVNDGGIVPLKICRRALGVSHLLFADDSLLFFKASGEQATEIKEVLEIYASSTGQLINPNKCSIMFGDSCPLDIRTTIKDILNVTQETFETKYLGLPTPEGRMTSDKFQSLQNRLATCLVEWDDSHKSQASKEVLIKAIAQSILVYVMSVFKLPLGLCDELTKMIRRYWLGVGLRRGVHHHVACWIRSSSSGDVRRVIGRFVSG